MTRQEVVSAVATEFGMTKKAAEDIVLFALDTIIAGAKSTGSTKVGQHKFYAKEKPARTAYNPRTREKVAVPPRTVITYKTLER